jgi:hypothetical protein
LWQLKALYSRSPTSAQSKLLPPTCLASVGWLDGRGRIGPCGSPLRGEPRSIHGLGDGRAALTRPIGQNTTGEKLAGTQAHDCGGLSETEYRQAGRGQERAGMSGCLAQQAVAQFICRQRVNALQNRAARRNAARQ